MTKSNERNRKSILQRETSMVETPLQEIDLKDISDSTRILDIGGGGEGLVSRIVGGKVCAIDYRMSEIREAQIHNPPAHWVVGDGRCLPFKEDSFDLCTFWFSLGYMSTRTIKKQVLREVFRSLKRNGKVSILASRIDSKEARFLFHALFTLPDDTESQVGYGVRGDQNQTTSIVHSILEESGFEEISVEEHDWWFKIEAVRK